MRNNKAWSGVRMSMAMRLLAPAACLVAALCPVRIGHGVDESEPCADAEGMILRRMQQDMMYGTDDFFGEQSDLSYVDRVTPTTTPPAPVVTKPTSSGSGGHHDNNSNSNNNSNNGDNTGNSNSNTGSSGSDGGSGGGTGDTPPDSGPPPDDAPPPPGDDCPS